ncbi:MAG: hypothetical protein ACPGQS_09430 [Bradymonadia bacterium]
MLLWANTESAFSASELPSAQRWIHLKHNGKNRQIRLAYRHNDSIGPLSPIYTLRAAKPEAQVKVSCIVSTEETRVTARWFPPDASTASVVTIRSGNQTLALINPQKSELRITGAYDRLSAIYEDHRYQTAPWQVKCEH